MTQLFLNAVLKKWWEKAHSEAKDEMKQLHFRNKFIPMHRRDQNYKERQVVLESHIFLKEKSDGKIKGWTVAADNKQCTCIPKEDAKSPTVATDSVLLTCIVNSK